jgi:hypothetical protein
VFVLIDSVSKKMIAAYQAPDHPLYGNGGDIIKIPHPFINNDLTGKEVLILDKGSIQNLKNRSRTRKETILTVLTDEFDIDTAQEEIYEPLHTGQFLDKKPVLVKRLPTGIKVRRLKTKAVI